jgi:hypothetical protein
MSKDLSSAARAYLYKLRNPYAADQLEEAAAEATRAAEPDSRGLNLAPITGPARKEKSPFYPLQDPYASLSEEALRSHVKLRAVSKPTCSKAAFRAGCTRIFRPYTPAPERGSLRDEHTAFIARNENHPGEVRYALLHGLQRLDLSEPSGIGPVMNREKDALTEEKLHDLERKILGG